MQPFLAESAPHRGRAFALAAAGLLVLVTIATAVGAPHTGRHHRHRGEHHHRLHTMGHCSTGGSFIIR